MKNNNRHNSKYKEKKDQDSKSNKEKQMDCCKKLMIKNKEIKKQNKLNKNKKKERLDLEKFNKTMRQTRSLKEPANKKIHSTKITNKQTMTSDKLSPITNNPIKQMNNNNKTIKTLIQMITTLYKELNKYKRRESKM